MYPPVIGQWCTVRENMQIITSLHGFFLMIWKSTISTLTATIRVPGALLDLKNTKPIKSRRVPEALLDLKKTKPIKSQFKKYRVLWSLRFFSWPPWKTIYSWLCLHRTCLFMFSTRANFLLQCGHESDLSLAWTRAYTAFSCFSLGRIGFVNDLKKYNINTNNYNKSARGGAGLEKLNL